MPRNDGLLPSCRWHVPTRQGIGPTHACTRATGDLRIDHGPRSYAAIRRTGARRHASLCVANLDVRSAIPAHPATILRVAHPEAAASVASMARYGQATPVLGNAALRQMHPTPSPQKDRQTGAAPIGRNVPCECRSVRLSLQVPVQGHRSSSRIATNTVVRGLSRLRRQQGLDGVSFSLQMHKKAGSMA